MERDYYLNLAESGLRMPIGTDLILKEYPDHAERLLDGPRLGEVYMEGARRFNTPLVFPLMDLTIEKADLCRMLGVPAGEWDLFHFTEGPTAEDLKRVQAHLDDPPSPRMAAACGAIAHVAACDGEYLPVGMGIGPFSFMVKLLEEPITTLYLANEDADEAEAEWVRTALEICTLVILRYARMQVAAGAKAICICEPAANQVYLSPVQLAADPGLFQRWVIATNLRLKALLNEEGVDLIFHDCGELTDDMVRAFNQLDPAILSLGSSRVLWEDAPLVDKRTVLYGNLPSKKFYSDKEITREAVAEQSRVLTQKMREAGHPFILGSECDVLHVPGTSRLIMQKVEAMLSA